MAHLDWNGQIRGQLELPDEIVRAFRLPGHWEKGKNWQLDPGHTVVIQPTYSANGRRAPKAPKIHWHDWMREQTKPWHRPADQPLTTLLRKFEGKDGFAHEHLTAPPTT